MRFLHTADWHIGKIVNEYSMIEDQKVVLDQIIEIANQEEVDVIVMAGDIYDRSLPSKEAVQLFNETLNKIHEHNLTLIAIAGNHDSPIRVQYASQLLKAENIFLAGDVHISKVSIGDTDFYLIPYADHLAVKAALDNDEITNLEKALEAQLALLQLDASKNNVAIYHGYVIKDSKSLIESDSERPLSIGNSEFVDSVLFSDFDYVALGHLHASQKVKGDKIGYSGSILKYSKSEANHKKSVKIVTIDNKEVSIETRDLQPIRDLKVIKGSFEEIMQGNSDDYVFFELDDPQLIIEAMNRLKHRYPYAMGLEYTQLQKVMSSFSDLNIEKIETLDYQKLFTQFYEHYSQKELSEEQNEIIINTLKESESN